MRQPAEAMSLSSIAMDACAGAPDGYFESPMVECVQCGVLIEDWLAVGGSFGWACDECALKLGYVEDEGANQEGV